MNSPFKQQIQRLCESLLNSSTLEFHTPVTYDFSKKTKLEERSAIRKLHDGILFTPSQIQNIGGMFTLGFNSEIDYLPWNRTILQKVVHEHLKEIYKLYQKQLIQGDELIDLAPAIAEELLFTLYNKSNTFDLIEELKVISSGTGLQGSIDARDMTPYVGGDKQSNEDDSSGLVDYNREFKRDKQNNDNPWVSKCKERIRACEPEVEEKNKYNVSKLKNSIEPWSKDNPKIIDIYLTDDGKKYIGCDEIDKDLMRSLINSFWFDSRLLNVEQYQAIRRGYKYNIVDCKKENNLNQLQEPHLNDSYVIELKRLAGLI